MISIGGAVTTSTSINIAGTRAAAAVEALVVAAAALTQSALVRAGAANAVILADGASFTQMDANAALIAHSVGGTPTVATAVDMQIRYVADPA
jgi:acyl-coenzyme A thioesterase PaaI-like protein